MIMSRTIPKTNIQNFKTFEQKTIACNKNSPFLKKPNFDTMFEIDCESMKEQR
jgi:hypothetical protein